MVTSDKNYRTVRPLVHFGPEIESMFPEGTVVRVYLRGVRSPDRPDDPPPAGDGYLVATERVGPWDLGSGRRASLAFFNALRPGPGYVMYAFVAGEHRWLNFRA